MHYSSMYLCYPKPYYFLVYTRVSIKDPLLPHIGWSFGFFLFMYLKMAYSGYFIQIPSFNTDSSVTTDSFMWKQMLRTVFMTNYQNWQMHKKLFFPGSQWTFKWIIDRETEKWNVAWVNVIAILASAFQKSLNHSVDNIWQTPCP